MTSTQPSINVSGRYSIKEAAQHLGVSYRTMQRYIADGKIMATYRQATGRPFITGQEIIKAWIRTI